jgi:competence protein ComGC
MKEKSRLSYVELVTVVIALSVVSIQVVPKFTAASEASRTDELIQGLQQMRTQLKLYSAQHENRQPPTDSFESFEAAMTAGDRQREPYVKKIPVNPCNGLNTVRFDGEPAGANKAGWRFDTESGSFQADDSDRYAVL